MDSKEKDLRLAQLRESNHWEVLSLVMSEWREGIIDEWREAETDGQRAKVQGAFLNFEQFMTHLDKATQAVQLQQAIDKMDEPIKAEDGPEY